MKKQFILLLVFALYTKTSVFAQLTITPGGTAQAMATGVVGTGVVVSNATLNCPTASYGTFSGTSDVGLTSGVLLTTGAASEAAGSASGQLNTNNGSTYTDPDLTAIQNNANQNTCALEFDIIPICETLQLKYVFASEEYPEFVCSDFNDIFGFFITGPNPGGGNYNSQNIAVIPGTSTPVAINSINPGVAGGGFNTAQCTSLSNSNLYFDNSGTTIVYDGFTVPLLAIVPVIPCQTYHFKLAIADALDDLYDSGVFLEQAGLTCPGDLAVITAVVDTAAEGCSEASLQATRSGDVSAPLTMNLTFGGTATSGTDYTMANTVSFAAGQSTVTVPLTAIADGASEGIETVTVSASYSVCGTNTTTPPVTITIVEGPALTFSSTGAGCTASNGSITATPSGGNPPYTFLWSTAPAQTSATATGLSAGIYYITVMDANNCTRDSFYTIAPDPPPQADFETTPVCQGEPIQFTDQSSTPSGTLISWIWYFDNMNPLNVQNPTYTFSDTGVHTIMLLVSNNNGCVDALTKTTLVHPLPAAQFAFKNACEGDLVPFTDGSSVAGTDIVQYWQWDFGDGSPVKNNKNPFHLYPSVGTYTVTLTATSNFGCEDTLVQTLSISPNPVVDFSASDTVGCSPLCVNFTNTASVSSGNIVSYQWSLGDNNAGAATSNASYCYSNNSILSAQSFDVFLTVTSDSGCVTSYTKEDYITVNSNPQADFSVKPESVSILNPSIAVTNLSQGTNAWRWDFADTTTSSLSDPPPHYYKDTGIYRIMLIVSNQYDCSDTAYQTITIEPDWALFIPNVFSPNGDGVNETFQGYGEGLKGYEMFIFDRWGNVIFTTKNYNQPWDGKAHNGSEVAQQDVYMYLIKIKDVKGKAHEYRGRVTLVK